MYRVAARCLAILTLVAILTFGEPVVQAAPPIRPDSPDVRAVQVLKPTPDSVVKFDEVKLLRLRSGDFVVHGSGTYRPGQPPIHVRFTVDPEKGTYKTESLPIGKELASLISSSHAPRRNILTLAATRLDHQATMRIVTEDPIQLNLAVTTNILKWYNYSGQSTVYWSGSDPSSCWANPDTPAGTSWGVQYCRKPSPSYNSSHTEVIKYIDAQYYNWDFGSNNLATYAWHWSELRGLAGGRFGFDWETKYSGEGSSLLYTDVFLNGNQIW